MKKNRKTKYISFKKYLGIIIAIIGLCIIMFPTFLKIYNKNMQSKVIVEYTSINKSHEEKETKKLEDDDFNKSLYKDDKFLTEFNLEDIDISYTTNTYDVMNLGDVISVISIPKIDLMLPIYEGTTPAVLQFGVGHIINSSKPSGGIGTNCLLTRHSGLSNNKIFDDITKLEIGDKFYLETDGEKLIYKIDDIKVVLPEQTDKIILDPQKDYVTLVTCTPMYINTHRLLVRGSRILEEDDVIVDDYELNKTIDKNKKLIRKEILQLILAFILFASLIIFNTKILGKNIFKKRYIAINKEKSDRK